MNFLVEHRGTPLAQPHSSYHGFSDTLWEGQGRRDVRVRLRRAEFSQGRRMAPLVQAEDTWSLWADTDHYLFMLRPSRGKPFWTVRCDRSFTSVTIASGRFVPQGRGRRLPNFLQYPLDQILLLHLLGDDGVIVHAGGAVREGRGFLFAGPSGAGKTTLARILERHGGFSILSDDRVVIRRDGSGFVVWGTPWPGEGGYARNEAATLDAIFFLRQGRRSRLRRLALGEALSRLLPVVSLPWHDAAAFPRGLALCGALLGALRVCEFTFPPLPAAAHALARTIAG